VSSAHGPTVYAAERRERAAVWLDDLRWHRHMFKESRFRWTGEHVMSIVTRNTGGQLDFTSLHHLELLERWRGELADYSHQGRLAMAAPLRTAHDTLPSWEQLAEHLRLSVVDCKATVWVAVGEPPEARTNVNVERVLRRLPFSNPLIQIWELTQLWRMYEAAGAVFEDTICDLIEELRGREGIDALVQATGTLTPAGLDGRVADARQLRGEPGDPRRIPAQVF
jgi:hypothetical protein